MLWKLTNPVMVDNDEYLYANVGTYANNNTNIILIGNTLAERIQLTIKAPKIPKNFILVDKDIPNLENIILSLRLEGLIGKQTGVLAVDGVIYPLYEIIEKDP